MTSSIERADNYVRWLVAAFRPYIGSRLLEIGTGLGNLRRHLPPLERFVSVDIDPAALERARARDPEGEYVLADAQGADFAEQAGGGFDTVFCANVLEHLDDERRAAANFAGALAPGGRLLLLVPALGALYNDLDRLAGHRRRYTKESVREILCADFETEMLEYFNPVGGLGWWMNRFMRHGDIDSSGVNFQVVFFDRVALPVSRMLNPLAKSFFGQSVICAARKK